MCDNSFCKGDPPCPTTLIKSFTNILTDPATMQTAVGFIFATVMRAFIGSLVKDIIMPPIGAALGKRDFSELFLVISAPRHETMAQLIRAGLVYRGQYATVKEAQEAGVDTRVTIRSIAEAKEIGAATWNYGLFVNNLINVVLTAMALAIFIYVVNKMQYWRWSRFCQESARS